MKIEQIKDKFIKGIPAHILDGEYFYYETGPSANKDLMIVWGGFEKCAPDYLVSRRSYPYYIVKYTISGKGTYIKGTQKFILSQDYISGFGPKDEHLYSCDSHDPLMHIFIAFTGSKAKTLFEQSSLDKRGAFKASNPADSLYLIKSLFKTGMTKPPYSQQICCAYLQAFLLNQNPLADDTQQTTSFNTYLRCKQYIDVNFMKIESIYAAAEECEINIRYMARLFRKYLRISPHEYIMRLKLNRSANLLLNSNMPVNKIAFMTGFKDPYHFSRAFKKFHNIAPSLYRRLHICNASDEMGQIY